MKCSIIIVNWNGKHWLEKFMPSVTASLLPDVEVLLADNASSDGGPQWVEEHHPVVRVLHLDQNYGYCGGNNRAARVAKGEVLIFLNNDVRVSPDWLSPVLDVFSEPKIGAAQPKLMQESDPDFFEYAGAAGGLIDALGYPFCQGRVFDTCERDEGQYDRNRTIFWASGAALAIRKELFLEAGGFDEDFEFHMEEIDLCWKLLRGGHEVRLVPASRVYHVGGGSLTQNSPRKLRYNIRNNLAMLWKHLPVGRLTVVLAARLALDAVATARELARLRPKHAWAMVQGHLHFWARIGQIQGKRRALKEEGLPLSAEGMAGCVLPWQYFVLGRRKASELTGIRGRV